MKLIGEVLFRGLAQRVAPLIICEFAARNPDDPGAGWQSSLFVKSIECWNQLSTGQVAGGAEDDYRAAQTDVPAVLKFRFACFVLVYWL